MSKGTVCVVGCGGFVGSHVTVELLSQGYSVRGTLRSTAPDKTGWVTEKLSPLAQQGAALTLQEAHADDPASLQEVMTGCAGVICCAGSPVNEEATIQLMTDLATNVSGAALAAGVPVAVFTSSTGSTNPPEGEPPLKNENDHWSDPEVQRAAGKFAAVGKTLYDQIIVKKARQSGGKLRVATLNPSMITGPCFQTEPVTSLKMVMAILKGLRLADRTPNSSMSFIDVRDLAKLHVAALENPDASGRYFAVKRSWHWQDILETLAEIVPDYKAPAWDPAETKVTPTAFDFSRQASLDVPIRDLREILQAVVDELNRRDMI